MDEERRAHKHRRKLITGWIRCFHRLHATCGLQLSHVWLKFGFDVHSYSYITYPHTHCLSALLSHPFIIRMQSLWLLIQILSLKTKALIKCSNCVLFYYSPITTSAVLVMTSKAGMLLSAHEEHKGCWQHGHCEAAQEHKHFCCQKNLWHTYWHDFTKHVKSNTTERTNHFCGQWEGHQITGLQQDIKCKIWDSSHFAVNTIKQYKYNSTAWVLFHF